MKLIFTLILLIVVCLSKLNNTQAQATNVQDSLALVDLYNTTNGNNWRDHTNWLKGPVYSWFGITCSTDINNIYIELKK